MSTTGSLRSGLIIALVTVVVAAGACGRVPGATHRDGTETMPGPASVWLTSDPAAPPVAVPVVLASLDDQEIRLRHTFAPGEVLRGDFAISQGRYRMTGLGGACSTDLSLGPSRIAEVVLTLDSDAGCSLVVALVGDMDDPAMSKDEPAVFITNGGAGQTPSLESPAP